MHPHGTLEIKPAGEPSRLKGIDDPEARQDGSAGTGRTHGRRSFRGAWHRRMARRPLAAECAHGVRRLSAGEERALAERGKAGDVDAEQQLITANLRLVLHAVREYRQCGVPLDDLIQEGNLGLIRAARHFDPAAHTARFATYATYWIRCFIVRALASNGSLIQRPEHAHLLRQQYRTAVDELRARGAAGTGEPASQSPSLDEVARYLGVPAHRLDEARLTENDQGVCQSLADLTLADGTAPEQSLVTNEDRAMVFAALRRLSPFEAWVICERFGLDEPPGRGVRQSLPDCEPAEENDAGRTAEDDVSTNSPASGSRPSESYFRRSYIDMGRDCGLSVLRLHQVEKTALDKLRGFLGRQITDES
jgi:RNA polymerase primary sigma factor